MTPKIAMTIFRIEGIIVTSLSNRNTRRILNTSKGPLAGTSDITTIKKSKTFQPLLKYSFRYAMIFRMASITKTPITNLLKTPKKAQYDSTTVFEVSNHIVTPFAKISPIMANSKYRCSMIFRIF